MIKIGVPLGEKVTVASNILYLLKGWSDIPFLILGIADTYFPFKKLEPGNHKFTKFIVMMIKFYIWIVLEFLITWIPSFHCCYDVDITHEISFLRFFQFLRFWYDGIYVTHKFSEFINAGKFTIPRKMWCGFFQCAAGFSSMYVNGCSILTAPFVWMLPC